MKKMKRHRRWKIHEIEENEEVNEEDMLVGKIDEKKQWRISDIYYDKLPQFQPMTPSRGF